MLHAAIFLALASQRILSQSSYVRSIAREDKVEVMQTLVRKLSTSGLPDVVLVSVGHIGLKGYYHQIQDILNAQSVVLYEGVKRPGATSDIPVASVGGKKPMYQILSDAVGLDYQLSDIDYRHANWVNSDLSMSELDRLNKVGGKGKATMFDTVKQMLDPNSPQTKMMADYFASASPSVKEAVKIVLIEQLSKVDTMMPGQIDPVTMNVILEERNKSVLRAFSKAVSTEPAPKSIAIFYGAAHMKEIQQTLSATYGYKPSGDQWLTMATADRKKLDASGKQMLEMMSSFGKL